MPYNVIYIRKNRQGALESAPSAGTYDSLEDALDFARRSSRSAAFERVYVYDGNPFEQGLSIDDAKAAFVRGERVFEVEGVKLPDAHADRPSSDSDVGAYPSLASPGNASWGHGGEFDTYREPEPPTIRPPEPRPAHQHQVDGGGPFIVSETVWKGHTHEGGDRKHEHEGKGMTSYRKARRSAPRRNKLNRG